MNKKLLALAVAAAVAPVVALADGSTVTLTGVINGSYENYKVDHANGTSQSNSGIGTNATRWNINGSEDLGDGLKAIFSLAVDQAFAGPGSASSIPGNVNTQIQNRNSFIGLAGDSWGSLKWGQNEHEYEIQTIKQDPFPASENNGTALTISTRFGINGGGGFTRRDSQTIWYATPDIGGFVGNLAYITPNGLKNDPINLSPSGWNLGLQYAPPGLGLTGYFGYASYKDLANTFANVVNSSGSTDKAWHLGLGYTIADLTVNAQYEVLKESGTASVIGFFAGATEIERKNYLLSADYRIGAGAIKFLYEKGKQISGTGLTAAQTANTDGKVITVGYWHDLSKRTSAYIDYYKVDNGANASYFTGTAGYSQKGFTIGLRTTF
jgi:predicted porin